jgi:exodeoxyribonuclease VII large subunit
VVLSPARVQGDGAGQDIARAIGLFRRSDAADVVIVGRGGGSIEDLWAFNEEVVARAIAACPVPVISAHGHEVDVTIADLIADMRAPTPSAAAECAVPDGEALGRVVEGLAGRLTRAVKLTIAERRGEAIFLRDALSTAAGNLTRERAQRLGSIAGKLDALSPLSSLRRGYAVPLAASGRVLRRAVDFVPGAPVRLRVADGSIDCTVDAVHGEDAGERAND